MSAQRVPLPMLALSGLSGALGFAGLGVALYGAGPHGLAAALLFGTVGLATGVACLALPLVFDTLPAQARQTTGLPTADGPSPLQVLARATLATAQQAGRPAVAGGDAPARPLSGRVADAPTDTASVTPPATAAVRQPDPADV